MGYWLMIVVPVALILQTIDNIFVSSLQDKTGETHAFWKEQAQKYPFMEDASQSPPQNSYDYIIVGGGTAGCPLAATLSRKFSVLLLERGGHPYGNDNITRVERFVISLADNEGQHTPAQQFVSEDGVVNTRPRVLGGGSCLNAGFYSRTSPEWVRSMNWDGNLVNKSYPWVENVVAFAPELGTFQSAFRNALLEVGVLPYNHQTYDHLLGTKIGGSIFDDKGNRHTAADLLQYAVKKNISVLLHAQVQQILFNNTGGQPRAYGVQYVDINGQQHTATLTDNKKGEVILSAGALGSPQLLMLSGIGPAEHLEAMGIKTLINLTTVGKNMADNPMNGIFLATKEPVETALIQVVGITNFGSYIESGSGDMSFRYSSVESPFGHMAELLEKVMGPLSTGELYLRSLDAADNPRVTFNYFAHPQDLARCVEGMSVIESIALSDTFKSIVFDNQSLPSGRTVGEARSSGIGLNEGQFQSNLESFCKKTVGTIWHYHGGCSIGSVVDENLHVLGVDALRVIDGSTFNFSPGTNPQATVMMLGRYMGEKILKERAKDAS